MGLEGVGQTACVTRFRSMTAGAEDTSAVAVIAGDVDSRMRARLVGGSIDEA